MSKAGAKSKFKKSYIKLVDKYINECKDFDEETKQKYKSNGKERTKYSYRFKVKLPSIEGFAKYIGVSRKSIYNWKKDNEEFAAALEKIETEQLERLINGGLAGTYNPTIAKLMLSSNHGMKEKIDATTNDESLNNFSDDQISRIAKRVLSRQASDGNTTSSK